MSSFLKKHVLIIVLVVAAVFVMLPGLDRPAFWQDEAETALLARSINQNGYPSAWDGRNIVTQLSGNDSNEDFVWGFTPWLPFYITAGSFKILGESNFAGRLPFVVIGILSLIGLYVFVLRLGYGRAVAVLSSVFLLLNMQFILYSRQCKYYSILFLVPPFLFFVYQGISRSIIHFLLFIILILILFYTNYVSLFTLVAGLTFYTIFMVRSGGEKRFLIRYIVAGAIALVLALPFFLVSGPGVSSSLISSLPTFVGYFVKLARHIWYFNNMVFGLILFIPLIMFYKKSIFNGDEKRLIGFILWMIVPAWLVLPLLNQDVFRYNLHLIPLFCILLAFLTVGFFRRSKVVGAVFLVLILTTNIFSNLPSIVLNGAFRITGVEFAPKGKTIAKIFRSDVAKTQEYLDKFDAELRKMTPVRVVTRDVLKGEYAAYFNELTTNYPDALEKVVTFLGENAKEGEIVYANFDLLPLMYYLPQLKYAYQVDLIRLVVPKGGELPSYITSIKGVGWYFYRREKMNLGPYVTDEEFKRYIKDEGLELTPYNLGISSLYWDINWPQRFYPYINKMLWRDTDGLEDVVVYQTKSR